MSKPWWTTIERADGSVKVEKHAGGEDPKLSAGITLLFAKTMEGVPIEQMGLYKRDPTKYPNEPNLLPEMQRKFEQRRR